ncbi:MAG: LapA family protein [bacterium]
MWIVRWIVLLLIIVTVLGFSLQNQDQMVTVRLLSWESGPVPLYLALFIAFGFGMAAFLLIAVFQQLQTLAELGRERKMKKKVEQQLEQTRLELEQLQGQLEGTHDEKPVLIDEPPSLSEDADLEPVEHPIGAKPKKKTELRKPKRNISRER